MKTRLWCIKDYLGGAITQNGTEKTRSDSEDKYPLLGGVAERYKEAKRGEVAEVGQSYR